MHEDDVERVLKAAGPREKPPAEMERALRESLRSEWRAVVAERQARRRRAALALAAGVMAAAIGTWLVVPEISRPAQAVGTVARADGELRVKAGRLGRWEQAGQGQVVTTGQVLATGRTGRGALALAGGISLRLDRGTRIRVADAGRLAIDRGAIYVDAGDGAGAASLEIITSAGSVRHLGTQYEVRVLDAGVRLRVREGRVLWASGAGTATGQAGEQLVVAPGGGIERGRISAFGADWDWTGEAAPSIALEGMTLTGFLRWAGRELGCRVEFSSPEVAQEAQAVVLHGSAAGLSPAEALEAVLATTRMQAVVQDGRILVTPRP